MIPLSGVIITYNEEKNILRCLNSIKDIVDEIIVVDSFSTDKTESICKNFNTIFIKQKFLGHIKQKNFAIKQASNNFVLCLDADEALCPTLKKSILKVKKNCNEDSYSFNRITNYNGYWVRHCGWYPDKKIRLFDKRKACWGGVNPHDKVILAEGASHKHIDGDILHYSYHSISEHIQQTDKFSTIAAKEAYRNGIKSNWLKIYLRTIFCFFRDYFLKLGILDGKYGFIICYINALAVMLKYSKIHDLEKKKLI
tara:strand:+ start:420 stop:1181 length:762 start_codon:yes stop_codon:yes gene_type:complete